MSDTQDLLEDLLSMLAKASSNKIYGSIEIYFEEGQVTQVTERTIRKVSRKKNPDKVKNSLVTSTEPDVNSQKQYSKSMVS